MIFTYDTHDYVKFLSDLAIETDSDFDGVTLTYNPAIATGTLRFIYMPGGLQAILSDYVVNADFVMQRIPTMPEVFTFRADFVEFIPEGSAIEVDNLVFSPTTSVYANMMMTSSRFPYKTEIKKGTKIKGLALLFDVAWIERYFPSQEKFDWVSNTHALRLNGINRVPLSFEQRDSLESLLTLDVNSPKYLISVQARIFELASHYYKEIIRQQNLHVKKDILLYDVVKIIELDIFFTNSIANKAEMPSIDDMATAAGMSATKLKTLFKSFYNQSIGEYFNSFRLNASRKLVLDGNIPLKEISAKFGFNTVQHFTSAFKAEFDITPAALQKTVAKTNVFE
jgi:AraC-like DNA-binding protein